MNSRLLVRLQKKHGSQRCRVELVELTVDDAWQICKLRLNFFHSPGGAGAPTAHPGYACVHDHQLSAAQRSCLQATRKGSKYVLAETVDTREFQVSRQPIHTQRAATQNSLSSIFCLAHSIRHGRSCCTIAKMKRSARYSGASPTTNALYTSRQRLYMYIRIGFAPQSEAHETDAQRELYTRLRSLMSRTVTEYD